MARIVAALLFLCVMADSAFAQIIYEPVRYQFGGQTPFYYGGNDRDMFRFAARENAQARNGFASAHASVMTHREISLLRPGVYVDHLQRSNAANYGYTIDDARNDAYRNAPRYFSKRMLFAQAVQDVDGAWHVPAQLSNAADGMMEIKPYVRPTTAPKRVIIIPKEMLDRKIVPFKKQIASAG